MIDGEDHFVIVAECGVRRDGHVDACGCVSSCRKHSEQVCCAHAAACRRLRQTCAANSPNLCGLSICETADWLIYDRPASQRDPGQIYPLLLCITEHICGCVTG